MTREEAIRRMECCRNFLVNNYSDMGEPNVTAFNMAIEALRPVTAEPKTGHWIEKYTEDGCGELYSYWACSECDRSVGFNLANIEDVYSDYPYCHCGAKMVEPQESEEQE